MASGAEEGSGAELKRRSMSACVPLAAAPTAAAPPPAPPLLPPIDPKDDEIPDAPTMRPVRRVAWHEGKRGKSVRVRQGARL